LVWDLIGRLGLEADDGDNGFVGTRSVAQVLLPPELDAYIRFSPPTDLSPEPPHGYRTTRQIKREAVEQMWPQAVGGFYRFWEAAARLPLGLILDCWGQSVQDVAWLAGSREGATDMEKLLCLPDLGAAVMAERNAEYIHRLRSYFAAYEEVRQAEGDEWPSPVYILDFVPEYREARDLQMQWEMSAHDTPMCIERGRRDLGLLDRLEDAYSGGRNPLPSLRREKKGIWTYSRTEPSLTACKGKTRFALSWQDDDGDACFAWVVWEPPA